MNVRVVRWTIVLALCLGLAPLAAQQPPVMEYWLLHQEVVKPSRLLDYEATSREFAAMVQAHRDAMPNFSFVAVAGRDLTYTYAAPIPSFSGIDALMGDFGALAMKAGEPFQDLMRRGSETMDSYREWVVAVLPELSYRPENPRLAPGEAGFAHFDFYHVLPGHEQEAEALAAEYRELFRSKGVPDGYWMMKALLGFDLPLYIVRVDARDAADFWAQDARLQALLGDEGRALSARALSLTRRFESADGQLRPDLSVWPPRGMDKEMMDEAME